MKKKAQILVFLTSLVLWAGTQCSSPKDECKCRPGEECFGDACKLKPGYYYLNGQEIHGNNLYHGIIPNKNICVDSLVFIYDTTATNDFDRYILMAKFPPYVQNVTPIFLRQINPKEFLIVTSTRICVKNNKDVYAYMDCKYLQDSIPVKMTFFTNDVPLKNTIIDSCQVTFYR